MMLSSSVAFLSISSIKQKCESMWSVFLLEAKTPLGRREDVNPL